MKISIKGPFNRIIQFNIGIRSGQSVVYIWTIQMSFNTNRITEVAEEKTFYDSISKCFKLISEGT